MNYKTLPKGYRFAGTMDFMRNRRQVMAVFKVAVALLFVPLIAGFLIQPPRPSWRGFIEGWYLWASMVGMLVMYIPLHELTHGAAMYVLSGVKPNYGLRLPYAWAGSPVWFDRKSHIITALAPVVFWGAALQVLIYFLPGRWFWPLWAVQISNLSGSAGDLYVAWALARMEGDLLVRDTGTRMTIMRKE